MTTISQRSMRERHLVGQPGQLAHLSIRRNKIGTFVNKDPQQVERKTLTIDTYTDGADYVLTIEGRTLTYTATTADADTSGVASSLADAINADPQIRQLVNAEASAAVITLESNLEGFSFSASESDAKMTLADVQSADQADPIPFGRGLFSGGASSTDSPDQLRLAKLPDAADVPGTTYQATPTVIDSATYGLTLEYPDGLQQAIGSFTASGSATAQEIVEGVAAAVDAEGITGLSATEDDATISVTVPEGHRLLANAAIWSDLTITSSLESEDLFIGISLLAQDEELQRDGTDGYAPNSAMEILESDGEVYVENDEGPTKSDPVYIELADGDDKGKFFKSSSPTRRKLDCLEWFASYPGDDRAILRVKAK